MFSGKVVVFGGYLRQILLVIPRGSISDIVHSTINASYIWDSCEVLTLTRKMLLQGGQGTQQTHDIVEFSKWILKIGEGRVLNQIKWLC